MILTQEPALHCQLHALKGDPRYSDNLRKWVRRESRNGARHFSVWLDTKSVIDGTPVDIASDPSPRQVLISTFSEHDGVAGSYLSNILCNGGSAQTGFYLGSPGVRYLELNGWWEQYLLAGKCHIDKNHEIFSPHDRYDVDGSGRTCRWCGRVERREEYQVTQQRWVWAGEGDASTPQLERGDV